MLLYILANLLLLLLGLGIVNLLDKNNTLTLIEKYVMGFILGIAINSFLLFICAWIGIVIGTVKYMDIVLVLGFGFLNHRKNLFHRLIPSDFRMPVLTKRDFMIAPLLILILFKAFFSLFNSVNVPSYFDDEKGNWNIKSKIIYHEGVMDTQSGSETYVGGGVHQEYPLNFILYKSYIADFMGGWDNSYINLITWIIFNLTIVLLIFSFPDRLFGTIVAYLIYSLPLVVWHSGAAYYDLVYTCFYLLSFIFFLKYIDKPDRIHLFIVGILLYSVIFTKNEGMVLIAPSILAGIGFYLYKEKALRELVYVGIPMLFIIPHMIFRWTYNLSFNPHSTEASYLFHSDSLGLYWTYFTQWGSYNIFWYAFPLFTIFFFKDILQKKYLWFSLSLTTLAIIIFLVFSFTNNYQFLLDQTTINRTLLSFMIGTIYLYSLVLYEKVYTK